MLPLWAWVELGVMHWRGTRPSPKPQHYWSLIIRLFTVISGHSLGKSYPSAEMQLVYSAAPADWARLWRWQITLDWWDAELTWLSPSAINWVCLCGSEHSFWIYGFRPTWPYLIIKVFATLAKFLESSDYSIVINCAFSFCTATVFNCFHGIVAQFELVNHKFQK